MQRTARQQIIPPKILEKLRSIAARLPESKEEAAWVGTRWVIRKRTFAHVLRIDAGWPQVYARAAGTDGPSVILTFRTSTLTFDELRTAGTPFFPAIWGTRWGPKVVGMFLDETTDWDEAAKLVTESYRLLAPKKLLRMS